MHFSSCTYLVHNVLKSLDLCELCFIKKKALFHCINGFEQKCMGLTIFGIEVQPNSAVWPGQSHSAMTRLHYAFCVRAKGLTTVPVRSPWSKQEITSTLLFGICIAGTTHVPQEHIGVQPNSAVWPGQSHSAMTRLHYAFFVRAKGLTTVPVGSPWSKQEITSTLLFGICIAGTTHVPQEH